MEFPKALRREPAKLLLYLNKELASAGYIAGERVIFLGRKEPSSFGALIDRYVKDYVICPVCGSPDTRTEKNKKLGFLLCEACGARSSIKANYAWKKILYIYNDLPLSYVGFVATYVQNLLHLKISWLIYSGALGQFVY